MPCACLYYLNDGFSNMSQSIYLGCMIVAVDIDQDSTRPMGPSVRDSEAPHAGKVHWRLAFVTAEDLLTDDFEAVGVVDAME